MCKKWMLACLIACCSSLGVPHDSFAKEPKNLSVVKENLIKYHDSGEYQKDQSKVIDQAMLYLKNRLATEAKTHSKNKLAIVLDIDETALSNYPDMLKMNFNGAPVQIDCSETRPAVQPTLSLFRYAKENNITVFFITDRQESCKTGTLKNLAEAGYKNFDGLIFKPENYTDTSISPYKISARDSIEKQGYKIILNIGDQESDLTGKHADKTFKLPNPYYLIP